MRCCRSNGSHGKLRPMSKYRFSWGQRKISVALVGASQKYVALVGTSENVGRFSWGRQHFAFKNDFTFTFTAQVLLRRRRRRSARATHTSAGREEKRGDCVCLQARAARGKVLAAATTLPRALGASTVAYGRPPAGQLRLLTYAFVSLLRNRTRGPAWCRSHGRAATFLHVSALARGGF